MHVSAGAGRGLEAACPPSTSGGKPAPSPCNGSLVSGLSCLSFSWVTDHEHPYLPPSPQREGLQAPLRSGNSQLPPPPAVALTPATMVLGPCFLAGEAYVAGGETEAWEEAARLPGKAWV